VNLSFATRIIGRTSLVISKHAPTILTVAGTAGFIGTTVLASKATLKLEETVAEEASLLVKVHEAQEEGKLSDKDAAHDKVVLYTRMATKLGKLYAPALILGAASIAALATGHGIMLKRNASLAAAYAAVDQAFKSYKKKVEAKFGKDAVLEAISVPTEELVVDGETTESVLKYGDTSPYGVIFDETNHNWSADEDLSALHLKCQQQYANDILQTRGHIFLNEVYKMLGFPHTPAGAITGWVKGNGDNFVDFNIHDGLFEGEDANGRLVTKWALDFNVDGVMYDKI
jgi:gp069